MSVSRIYDFTVERGYSTFPLFHRRGLSFFGRLSRAEYKSVFENGLVQPGKGGEREAVATNQPAECESDEEVAGKGQMCQP